MSELTTLNTTTAMPIPAGFDPFANIASQEAGMEGSFLRFKQGLWYLGADKDVVAADAQFAALVGDAMHGYQKWVDRKVEARVMVRVADSLAPARAELGDNDPDAWPVGPQGREDPWAFSYIVPMIAVDDETRVIFSTSSVGGRKAVGKLTGAYATQRKKVAGTQYPIIQLRCDSYDNKKTGMPTQFPVFRIVDWVVDAAAPAIVPATTTPTAMARHLDDEIPF